MNDTPENKNMSTAGDKHSSPLLKVLPFVVLVAVLVFRPSGLLGQRTADRA